MTDFREPMLDAQARLGLALSVMPQEAYRKYQARARALGLREETTPNLAYGLASVSLHNLAADLREIGWERRAAYLDEVALLIETARADVQSDVREFHEAVGAPVGETIELRRAALRAELIREEAKEAVDAIEEGDLAASVRELCDLLCVVYGAAVEWGVDLTPVWREVHRSNMAKKGGPVRDDGKALKPDGWEPPDIEAVLDRLREE